MPAIKKVKQINTTIPSTHVVNPQTGRLVLKDSRSYQRLVAAGIIDDDIPLPPPNEEPPHTHMCEALTKKQELPDESEIKESEVIKKAAAHKLACAQLIEIAKKNSDQLQGMSKGETNALLRRLLIEKLTGTSKTCANEFVKAKKKKKSRYKIESSSESESESD